MFRRFMLIPAVLAVGLGVAGGYVVANPVTPEKPATAVEKRELALREKWGFTRDLEAVRRIDAKHAVSYLGFPMSEHERAQMRSRSRLGAHIGDVSRVVGADPHFGGVWLINRGSGSIGVGWVGVPDPARVKAARAVLPDPSRLRFIEVAHSRTHLLAIQQQIFDEIVGVRQGLTPFRSSSVDVVRSVVEVTVASEATADTLRAEYPADEVHVTVGRGVAFQAAPTSHPAGSSGR